MNKSNVTQLSPITVQQTPSITTSSENSETQSVNDEPINNNNNRSATKLYNNKKQNEKERPPWRSTANVQMKADRNALLKAKLLDASRRALRAQKTSTVSIQTDPIPTVLVKEVQIDIQNDLIEMIDQSMETDGAITIKKESPGGFILTQTVGQMTEQILYNDVGTQTALPKTTLAFKSNVSNQLPSVVEQRTNTFALHQRADKPTAADSTLGKQNIMSQNEELINRQINEIRRIDELLLNNNNTNNNNNNNNDVENKLDDRNGACKNDEDNGLESNSLSDDSLQDNNIQSSTKKTPNLLTSHNNHTNQQANINFNEPTLTSWDHFDSDDEDDEFMTFSRNANKPNLRDFRDDIIDQRLSNMKLSPILLRRRPYLNAQNVRWHDRQQQAVNDLISETTKLMDVFDQIGIMLGPELKLKSPIVQQKDEHNKMIYVPSTPQPSPSSKLVPILTQTCELLEKQLREFDT